MLLGGPGIDTHGAADGPAGREPGLCGLLAEREPLGSGDGRGCLRCHVRSSPESSLMTIKAWSGQFVSRTPPFADRAICVPFPVRRHRFATVYHGHCCPFDLGALYYRCAATRMVRMGSPVRFRRGLHPKSAAQAGSNTRPVASPRAAGRRCQRFASSICMPCVVVASAAGARRSWVISPGRPLDWRRVERQVSPTTPLRVLTIIGVPQDLPEQAVARHWCEARHEEDIGYRSAPGGIDADPSHPRRALRHRCCRCGSAQVFSRGLSARGVGP